MELQQNVPLADKNWFQTGGSACYFMEPTNPVEFQAALEFAQQKQLPLFVLGQGANVLISDEGFDGLVIRPQLKNIVYLPMNDNDILVTAGAGVILSDLIEDCLNHHVIGLEEFSGIPGTVGGSTYINLHYYEFLLSQFLVNAQVIDANTGEITTVDNSWFKYGYNQSKLLDKQHYLLNATFKLKRCTPLETAFARGRRTEIIRHRVKRYPSTHTCGSFFRNFYESEVIQENEGKKMIYVAYYLDKLGVKGALTVGDATVSYQHANMIVNRGKATTSDIVALARRMQEMVRDEFGITPQPECQLIGFAEYPLL